MANVFPLRSGKYKERYHDYQSVQGVSLTQKNCRGPRVNYKERITTPLRVSSDQELSTFFRHECSSCVRRHNKPRC
jgi:hypothetical protein